MMLPPLGTISAYTFTTDFASLNGIYELTELVTYDQAIANGVDFASSLYTPAGVATTQLATDAPTYVGTTVLMLTPVNVTNGTPIYVPTPVLATTPDSMVACYNNVALGINFGLFQDQTTINWVITELNQILKATLGIDNPAILYSLGTQYMKITDFELLQAQRAAQASEYNTLYSQLQSQIALSQSYQNIIQYYQNTLIALAASTGGN